MRTIESLLNKAFPLMALTGLLLAGYGMVSTPDEMKAGQELPRLTAKLSLSLSPHDNTQSPLE
jgi:hypothetical protein